MPSRKFSSIEDIPNYLLELKNNSFSYEAIIGCWFVTVIPMSFVEEWFEDGEDRIFPLSQQNFTVSLTERIQVGDNSVWDPPSGTFKSVPTYFWKKFSICEHSDFSNLKLSQDKKWESKDRVDCTFDELCELLYYMDRLTGLAAFR